MNTNKNLSKLLTQVSNMPPWKSDWILIASTCSLALFVPPSIPFLSLLLYLTLFYDMYTNLGAM